jgi:KDO2-lipid IV(A) lauroyltransferase
VIPFWLRLFFRLTAIAPGFIRALKPLFVRLAWWFAPSIRRGTNANAHRIFNHALDEMQLRRFSLAVIGCFYEFVFDVGRSLRASRQELETRIASVEGHAKYVAARASRRGAILLTAHMGSFELGTVALTQLNERVHVVFRRDQIDGFERLRSTLHQRLGIVEAALDDKWTVWLRLRDALQANEVVAIQGDRVMPGQNGMEMPFLGGHLLLPTGPVKLASASGAPIIPVFTVRSPDGRVRICVEDAIDVPHPFDDHAMADAMRKIAEVLAKYVREYPEQWLVLVPAFSEDRETLK